MKSALIAFVVVLAVGTRNIPSFFKVHSKVPSAVDYALKEKAVGHKTLYSVASLTLAKSAVASTFDALAFEPLTPKKEPVVVPSFTPLVEQLANQGFVYNGHLGNAVLIGPMAYQVGEPIDAKVTTESGDSVIPYIKKIVPGGVVIRARGMKPVTLR